MPLAFAFHGDSLAVVRLPDGDVAVSLRALCDALGLDFSGQLQRLRRVSEPEDGSAGSRWATVGTAPMVAADGKVRDLLILPRRSIPMWAATVDASRVAEEVRPKLVAYQDDAAEALARAFLPGVAPASQPAGLPQGVRGEAARLFGLTANALEAGDEDTARRFQYAAWALIRPARGPVGAWTRERMPGVTREQMAAQRLDRAKARVVALLRKVSGPLTSREVILGAGGRSEDNGRALAALAAEGVILKRRPGPGPRLAITLAPAPAAEVH